MSLTSKLMGVAGAIALLFLLLTVMSLEFLLLPISVVLVCAGIGLPWYLIASRRRQRMIREMDEAASKDARGRPPSA